MKESRIHYNFQLPIAYDSVFWTVYSKINGDKSIIGKGINYNIKKTDVFKYIFDIVADTLDIEISNGKDIEFIETDTLPYNEISPEEKLTRKMENNSEFRAEEYRLALELSKDPKCPLVEYDRNYKPKGVSLQEFVRMKELDLWSVLYVVELSKVQWSVDLVGKQQID